MFFMGHSVLATDGLSEKQEHTLKLQRFEEKREGSILCHVIVLEAGENDVLEVVWCTHRGACGKIKTKYRNYKTGFPDYHQFLLDSNSPS